MPITTAKTPKVYVAVRAEFTEDGTMLPREITWEDGEKYEIDRVSQICQAAAMLILFGSTALVWNGLICFLLR